MKAATSDPIAASAQAFLAQTAATLEGIGREAQVVYRRLQRSPDYREARRLSRSGNDDDAFLIPAWSLSGILADGLGQDLMKDAREWAAMARSTPASLRRDVAASRRERRAYLAQRQAEDRARARTRAKEQAERAKRERQSHAILARAQAAKEALMSAVDTTPCSPELAAAVSEYMAALAAVLGNIHDRLAPAVERIQPAKAA